MSDGPRGTPITPTSLVSGNQRPWRRQLNALCAPWSAHLIAESLLLSFPRHPIAAPQRVRHGQTVPNTTDEFTRLSSAARRSSQGLEPASSSKL